jgi:aspartate aminotransferase
MVTLSKRVQSVSLSANAAARQLTRQLKEQGVDILDLTTGEPDFDTPQHIRQAAVAAMEVDGWW